MAKNTYIIIETIPDFWWDPSITEIKGEINKDKIKFNFLCENDLTDKISDDPENWLESDDETLINAFEFLWDDCNMEIERASNRIHIYSLSSNSTNNEDSISKRAENLRKLIKKEFC